MNTTTFLNKIKETIKHYDSEADVMLYGSRARGDNKNNSDWDFLIILNQNVNEKLKDEIRNELFEMELESDQVISSIIHSKQSWNNLSITPLYKNIYKEGIRL
jgi:predicted nucleotidyltransferase